MQEVFTAIFATIILGLFVAFAVVILWGLIKFLLFLNRLYGANRTIQKAKTEAEVIRKNAYENSTTILNEANKFRAQANTEADYIRTKANTEAESIQTQARADANKFRAQADIEADYTRRKANTEAESIRMQAHVDADEIRNKAREEATKCRICYAEQLEHIKKEHGALQRKIEGYGREYMIPGIGLLDDLAIDFGHTEAGQELKKARTNVREMFKMRESALCDYVEKNRQDIAVDFVVDAFNGKVEEILSRVKHDNYGKLAQEIRDAAILVNKNGGAFRNARINPVYVDARVNELKWATIVHELKLKEREEQKAIREQIREEEKVRKEIEKAKKEAEKEAALAKKIYDELQRKFEAMSAEEKALHAKELADAEERIRLAEEKGQRAMSMAQQTKQGHVYVISNIGSFGENVYKIGMTRRLDPTERVRELGDASVPFPFDIHGMIHFDDCPAAEKQLHRLFLMGQMNKTNFRKEFFRVNLEDIKSAIEKLGGEAHWTMLAEAAQYRETLRMEERIENDIEYRKQWEERQIRLEDLEDSPFAENDE
jgi:F0F1-type ATP synthase membrane subunit b/b'